MNTKSRARPARPAKLDETLVEGRPAKSNDQRGARTHNLLIRSQTPCHWASRPCFACCKVSKFGRYIHKTHLFAPLIGVRLFATRRLRSVDVSVNLREVAGRPHEALSHSGCLLDHVIPPRRDDLARGRPPRTPLPAQGGVFGSRARAAVTSLAAGRRDHSLQGLPSDRPSVNGTASCIMLDKGHSCREGSSSYNRPSVTPLGHPPRPT